MDNEAVQFGMSLGIGWNLGNQFDAHYDGCSYEEGWGNKAATQQTFNALKKAGFRSVRIPVTWMGHIGNAQTYTIEGGWLDRVNAERCLNYILGQNATGYCYVTGFGTNPTKHPHHRLSYSHPKGTLPGFLAGGPNPMRQDAETDGVKYPKNVPADESYLDYQPSYASNEVTINWNVTLFALTAGLDALND